MNKALSLDGNLTFYGTSYYFNDSGAIYASSVSLAGADLGDANMIGSSNAVDVPCVFEGADDVGSDEHRFAVRLETYGSGNPFFTYAVPLPTVKGGLDLHISAIKFEIHDVDSNDFITTNYLYGIGNTSITSLETDTTNYTTTGLKTHSFGGGVDVSAYKSVKVYIDADTAGTLQLDIGAVYVTAYYA